MNIRKEIGSKGEDIAVKALKKLKYKIVERNFNVPGLGEIDIIALDGDYLVFVEVRVRKNTGYGSGAETIDFYKQRRLIKTAEFYMKQNNAVSHLTRFDVVSITGDVFGDYEIEIIKNAIMQ